MLELWGEDVSWVAWLDTDYQPKSQIRKALIYPYTDIHMLSMLEGSKRVHDEEGHADNKRERNTHILNKTRTIFKKKKKIESDHRQANAVVENERPRSKSPPPY